MLLELPGAMEVLVAPELHMRTAVLVVVPGLPAAVAVAAQQQAMAVV